MDARRHPRAAPTDEARSDTHRPEFAPAVLLRPSEADIATLLALRMQQNLDDLDADAHLERLEALGLIAFRGTDYPQLTARGTDLLRRWLS